MYTFFINTFFLRVFLHRKLYVDDYIFQAMRNAMGPDFALKVHETLFRHGGIYKYTNLVYFPKFYKFKGVNH